MAASTNATEILITTADALKISIPLMIGLTTAIVTLVGSGVIAVVSYFLNRRMKLNTLRVKRAYDLAEKIAQKVEQIETGYFYLEEFYKSNYGHIDELRHAIDNFNRKTELFSSTYDEIRNQATRRSELQALMQGAWLYLPNKVLEPVTRYFKIGEFSYTDDAAGFINEYHYEFFKNLLGPNCSKERNKLFKQIVKRYSKLKV